MTAMLVLLREDKIAAKIALQCKELEARYVKTSARVGRLGTAWNGHVRC